MAAARDAEQHTPFCEKDCKLSHHELIKALFLFNNFSDGYSNPGHLHLFYESIQSCISQGWPKDSIVPDPSRDLQCPLAYLACAFGKPKALGLLLKMGFEPNVCIRQTGETGLHAAVRYVYQSGAWSVNKRGVSKVRPKTRTSSFEKILDSLSEKCPEILGQKDINWDTPLHIAAQELSDIREEERDCTGKKLLMALNNRKVHFEQCFKSMLAKVMYLQDKDIISAERGMQIICTKNRERKSILNMLSEGVSDKDASLEFLKSVLSELERRLLSNSVPVSGSGIRITDDQGFRPSMVPVHPYHITPSVSQAPQVYVQPQNKQPRKRMYNQSKGKQEANPRQPQFIMSQSSAQGNAGESSIIHVVFGAGDKTMKQNTENILGSHPAFILHSQQADAVTTKVSEAVPRKQPQRKPNRYKRKSSECSPQIDNICSTSKQNKSIPPKASHNNVASEEPRLPEKLNECNKSNESSSETISTPNEIHTFVGKKFDSAKDSLRRELRESYQTSFSLEKECFKLESERIECLHGIKIRKEKIEELQKQMVELEQKAVELANSKFVVETNWKAVQEKEKELKTQLFSPNPNTGHNVTESSKRLKLD